jgi:hypothetical protein
MVTKKETRNSYKYGLQAPSSIRRMREKNTNSVPSSIYHNFFKNIQPSGQFGQEPEPSQATGMALVRCILGKLLGVVCH